MRTHRHAEALLSWMLTLALAVAWGRGAEAMMTYQEAEREVIKDVAKGQVGEALLAEDFEDGTLDRWSADQGWSIVERQDGKGTCAQAVASEKDHEDLVLKQRIPVAPGHPIAVCWKARFVSGRSPLYIRMDYFDENGKQGKPYARQQPSQQGDKWTQNVLLVSEWFPEYTRAITIWFHHEPGAKTTSLLDDIRVVDLADAASELIARQLSGYVAMGERLAREDVQAPRSPVGDYWKAIITARAPKLAAAMKGGSAPGPPSAEHRKAIGALATQIRRLVDMAVALKRGDVAATKVAVYRTKPITSRMVLPHTAALEGQVTGKVQLTACPGEYEPASLVLWAPEDLSEVLLTPGDLEGPQGKIPAQNVDIKWVKCWHQGGNAPYGIGVERGKKALIPELLLHDDALVKVDYENQRNHLKLAFPDGPKYVPIDDPTVVPWGNRYTLEEFPVKDSPALLPTDLPEGENKQVWITVKVPEAAQAGQYAGKIVLTAGEEVLGAMALRVRVLPFTLAAPRTHYDLEEGFTYSLYYWGELDPTNAGTIGYECKSEQQFRAELRYMYEHGIVAPAMIWSPKWVYGNEEFFRRHLEIAREIGMAGRPLYFADSGLVRNPTDPDALEELRRNVRRTIEIAREHGFTGVYFYAIDEARGDVLNSQRKAWEAVHEAGGRIIVSGYAGHLEQVGDILDLLNWAGASERAQPAEWHKRGNKIWNYANPQTPVEDPAIYRRNYGLKLWRLDFDGACTYCFMDSEGRPWNDFDGKSYRNHNVAYPTVDGVVGTLALEGFREGADDVKYATVLRLEIEKALADGTPEAKEKAKVALDWLEGLDMKEADLDEVREAMIREIMGLRKP